MNPLVKTCETVGEVVVCTVPAAPADPWAWSLQLTVAVAVGLFTLIGVVIITTQKWASDRRAEWWRRVQWALERTTGDSDESALAFDVLGELVTSSLATQAERDMLGRVSLSHLRRFVPRKNGSKKSGGK